MLSGVNFPYSSNRMKVGVVLYVFLKEGLGFSVAVLGTHETQPKLKPTLQMPTLCPKPLITKLQNDNPKR